MSSTEIDFYKIVRLTNWKLQLDAQPNMSTRVDLEREWEKLNDIEWFLCKIASSIVLERQVQFQTTNERAEHAMSLAKHFGADVKRQPLVSEERIEVVIYPRGKIWNTT